MGCSRHDHVDGPLAAGLCFLFFPERRPFRRDNLRVCMIHHLYCHRGLLSPAETAGTVCTTGHHPVCVQKQNSPIASGLHSIYVVQCVPHKIPPPLTDFQSSVTPQRVCDPTSNDTLSERSRRDDSNGYSTGVKRRRLRARA